MGRRLKVSEKTLALRKVPLFALCSDQELEQLAGLATEVEVHADQVLCTIGDPGYEFFVLLDGTGGIVRSDGSTVEIGPGDFFGELSLLVDGGVRTATVTATSGGKVLVMSGAEFRELLRAVPQIAIRLLAELGGRLYSGSG